MCMACDLLQGLDLDELSPPEDAGTLPLLLGDAVAREDLERWFPARDATRYRLIRRCPARHASPHWNPQALAPAVTAIAAGESWMQGLGFAQQAIEAFRHFWQDKLDGVLPPPARFVMALPTPYTVVAALAPAAPDVPQLLSHLETAFAAEVASLLQTVPADQLAIQWDVGAETRIWETRGRDLAAPRGLPERLLESCVALSAAVPVDSELGWHFCPRDPAGQITLAPRDSAQVTRLLGAIIASTDREPQYVHMPVPAERDDPVYFEPLANLALWPRMDVHLGLVHDSDDTGAAQRRIAAARSVLRRFGIAPACGADPRRTLPQLAALALSEVEPQR